MPSTPFLTATFGSPSTMKYKTGGVSEIYLIPRHLLQATEDVLDARGNVIAVSGMTLASSASFYQVGFLEGTGEFTDEFAINGNNRFMDVTLKFVVNEGGQGAAEFANQMILTPKHAALVKLKADGKYYLLGLTDGLQATAASKNSGAKKEDEANLSVTLVGTNHGFAAEVTMDAASIAGVVTRISA